MKKNTQEYVIADKALLKIINEQDEKIKDIIGRIEILISGAKAEYYAVDKDFIVDRLQKIVDENKEKE